MKITINVDENEEIISLWLSNLLKNEIDEALGAASNEHLFSLGSSGEASAMHEENSEINRKYAEILKKAYDDINEQVFSKDFPITASFLLKVKDDVRSVLENKVDELYLELQNKYGIKYGDITPDMSSRQEECIDELIKIITNVLIFEKCL